MRTFLAASLLLATIPAFAQEQPPCGPVKEVLGTLEKRYKEKPAAIGAINEQAAMLITVSPGGDTYTVLIYKTDGTACLLTKGVAFSRIFIEPRGEKV